MKRIDLILLLLQKGWCSKSRLFRRIDLFIRDYYPLFKDILPQEELPSKSVGKFGSWYTEGVNELEKLLSMEFINQRMIRYKHGDWGGGYEGYFLTDLGKKYIKKNIKLSKLQSMSIEQLLEVTR